MLRQLIVTLANKGASADQAEVAVVVKKDELPRIVRRPATMPLPRPRPKSICTSLKDLCEL